jgi:mono/diheme cytochrome c family protein
MSSYRNGAWLRLPALLAGAVLACAPVVAVQAQPASGPAPGDTKGAIKTGNAAPIPQQQDEAVWAQEGSGGGKLPQYHPAQPPGHYGIGAAASDADVAAWTIAVPPDGAHLPPGQGTVEAGGNTYNATCATCHGTFGEGANGYPALVGGVGSLGSASPVRTVGSYLPYATTLWDYINRAMPFYAPHSLKPDQVYGLTAYILNMNEIVPDDFVADAKSITALKMPNRDGFDWKDPRPMTHNTACMSNCADPASVKVTSDASTMNLTPRMIGPLDDMAKKDK